MPTAKLFATLGFVASFTSQVALADQVADIKQKGELVCGTLGITRGMSFVDEDTRQLAGYEVDLCAALAESLKVKPVLKTLAAQARIPELQQGRVDILLANLAWTEERAKVVDYSYPYFVVRSTVMVNTNSNINNFEQLGGKKIATIKGSTTEHWLRTKIPAADIVSFDTTAQAFLAFVQGKVTGHATDESRLRSSRAAAGRLSEFALLSESLGVDAEGAGIKKGEAEMLKHVNSVLSELERSGEADKLFMKWFGPGTIVGYDQRTFKIDGTN